MPPVFLCFLVVFLAQSGQIINCYANNAEKLIEAERFEDLLEEKDHEIKELKKLTSSLITSVSELKEKVDNVQETCTKRIEGIERSTMAIKRSYEAQLETLDEKTRTALDLFNQSTGTIAFAAELTHTVDGAMTIIPFGREMLNLGGAYNIQTYTFTSTIKGLFYFSWSSLKSSAGNMCSQIAVDGVLQEGYGEHAGDTGFYVTSSQVAILLLYPGNQVNVRMMNFPYCTSQYYTEPRFRCNSFKGFLIRNMEN